MVLALVGLVVGLFRLFILLQNERRVRQQLNHPQQLSANNALARVLSAAQGPSSRLEDLELRIDEAILGELPKIERGQSLVKLFAGLAPRLGLLGTVLSMITTFQNISLYGSSDPKFLAAGISQALITTVLGLLAAIPLLFCRSLMSARSRILLQVIQQKGLALLAQQHRHEPSSNAVDQ
ncbi:MotA/TolQ/ExbB proton channel family protein [Agarivorans sp. QJM3NY_33]|uniref:MotA/TolQ/ExbB proton channel family protein n=1 Tax=Agarivorans sp. QJM3NY_33 TaxID=3421432 RepID=UPI003D7E5FD0